jgi:hypothetical protein
MQHLAVTEIDIRFEIKSDVLLMKNEYESNQKALAARVVHVYR